MFYFSRDRSTLPLKGGSLLLALKTISMATTKQKTAAKKNIVKAQKKWKSMTARQRALAQPQGRSRKKPGTGGEGAFYRVEVRPARAFSSFRTQDVGKKGGLERIAGHRPSGSWDTATWLVSKKDAHVTDKKLVITGARAKTLLKDLGGPIVWVKGDIFKAPPRKNIPEKAKPTAKQKAARLKNIRKAQKVHNHN